MDTRSRRSLLTTAANPGPHHDYLVQLSRLVPFAGTGAGHTTLSLRYVPDRAILAPPTFERYLDALAGQDWTPEALAVAVLDDLNNELLPRWLQVEVARNHPFDHRAAVEDRQPTWDNPAVMARLPPL